MCVCDAVRLYISSLHNSTCPFFFWFGPHKEVLCLVLSPWLLFSCSLMQGKRRKESFPKAAGLFPTSAAKKTRTHFLQRRVPLLCIQRTALGFSRGAQTVRPERRRGRGTVIWVISLSRFPMQSTQDPLNAWMPAPPSTLRSPSSASRAVC